jgi:molecular chaperone GrpE
VSQNDSHEPVTVTDKRRIDPETGEIRQRTRGADEAQQATGPAPSGPAPEAAGDASEELTELKSTLQRVKAEYDNYRKRSLRDQQLAAERTKVAVVTQLLPVLDDLDRARSHGDLESGPLKSVADKLATSLEGLGLSGFGAITACRPSKPQIQTTIKEEGKEVTRYGPTRMGREGLLQGARRLL